MSSIDERIVSMKFDNAQFEQKAGASLSTLDKLKKSLDFSSSKRGLDDLHSAAGRFNLGPLATTVEGVSAKFLALSTIGVTALANIATKAFETGTMLAKSLTVDPINAGLKEYETNLNSVQTILANTQASGAGLKDVTGALDELNVYSDKTIYNFSEMARNIGTFTAAGVDLKTSTQSIKGIANLAALSGSNSQQAATAMYQLSQAISSGKVSLMDWNSVVNAGMGGTVFQRALAQTAEKMGTLEKGSVKLSGAMKNVSINGESFRESISGSPGKGERFWLTSDVLTQTLKQFTGDLSDAQLAAQGFSKAQIKAIQAQAKTALEAATKVKTLSQVIDVAKETAQSGWSQTWRYIFGDFEQARTTFTNLSNFLNGAINRQADARNKLLAGWSKLGGRKVAISALKEAFDSLMTVIRPIQKAFREIFPRTTSKQLFDMTRAVRNFFHGLKMGAETGDKLRRTFKGIFAIFSIAKTLVVAVAKGFGVLFKAAAPAGGGFLSLTANIGDFLVKLDKTLKEGTALTDFFKKLGSYLAVPINLIGSLAEALAGLFNKDQAKGAENTAGAFEKVGETLSPIATLIENIKGLWEGFVESFNNTMPGFKEFVGKIGEEFSKIGEAIGEAIKNGNYDKALAAIKTGLFGGLVVIIGKFVKNGLKFDFGQQDMFKAITGTFEALTGNLKAMQTQIKAKAILMIASAVALLAASVVALSFVDPKKLAMALGGLTVMLTELVASMAVIGKLGMGGIKFTSIAAGLVLMALAITILSGALKILSTIDFGEMTKGLAALAVILLALSKFMSSLSKDLPKMIGVGAGIILIAIGIRIMANAVRALGDIGWVELLKGLASVSVLLVALGEAMSKIPVKGMVRAGIAINLIAVSMLLMARAVEKLGSLEFGQLVKGIVSIAAVLTLLRLAMNKISDKSLKGPAGLVLISFALGKIADVLTDLGKTDLGELIKSLLTLGIVLALVVAAMVVMDAAKSGAMAMIAAAGAVFIMAEALAKFSEISWGDLIKGLVGLALLFVIIGAAAIGFGYIAPLVLGLAIAIAILGAGLAAFGLGALLFAKAIQIIIEIANLGVEALGKVVDTAIGILPKLGEFAYKAMVELAKAIFQAAPAIVTAGMEVVLRFLEAVAKMAPKIRTALGKILNNVLKFLEDFVPKFIVTGATIVLKLIQGLKNKMPAIITEGANLLVGILKGVARAMWRVAIAMADVTLEMARQIPPAIDKYSTEFGDAGGKILVAIVKGLHNGMGAAGAAIAQEFANMATDALGAFKQILGINSPSKEFIKIGKAVGEGFIIGVVNSRENIRKSLDNVGNSIKTAMAKSASDVEKLKKKLSRLRSAKKPNQKEIRETEKALAEAVKANKQANRANKVFNKGLIKQKQALLVHGKEYERLSVKLNDARQKLADAIKERDDFAKSIKDQYSKLPDISQGTSVKQYFNDLRKTIAANNKFKASLDQLRDLGLDDASYKKLLEVGVDAQPFIDRLLAGGAEAIAELNNLDAQLATSAEGLGTTAARELYQAGVDSAKGLVDGLEAQMATLTKKMKALGKAIADAVKKELGIKSPSKVFAKIGRNVNEGFAKGIGDSSNVVKMAAKNVGDEAIDGMRSSLSNMGSVISGDLDVNPVIAPVLDLDEFRKNAMGIDKVLSGKNVSVDVAANNAKVIATDAQDALMAKLDEKISEQEAARVVNFNQYNNSPKALSDTEIYRQTKNQLSQIRRGG
jgi:tape measure domain-containing protein